MDEKRIFVGRKAELDQFKQILEDPRGQAILVVGQAGMGKSWLLDRMAQLAQTHPDLKCGYVRYEVTRTDSTGSTMALMIDHAFEAAQAEAGSFDKTDQRKRQWHALFKTVVPKGSELLELAQSLRRDPQKHTRDQFLDRLRLISRRMPEDGRAVFAIDPEKYMEEHSADAWRLVVRELPEKIKFLFAQRPEDELVKSNDFLALPNIVRIPGANLDALADIEVDELVRQRTDTVGQDGRVLGEAVSRYKGHPYAIQAALDIVEKTGNVDALPADPTPKKVAETQWQQICHDADAIRLFEAYAILEVGVPVDVAQTVSKLDRTACKRIHSDTYLRGLLREEGQGRRIYHAILTDHVLTQMQEDERTECHHRAAECYRATLKQAEDHQAAPDALAATRLPEHVLAAEGEQAFVDTFINESGQVLITLGLLDKYVGFWQRGFKALKRDSTEEAAFLGNFAVVCLTRGDLQQAEDAARRALGINERLGPLADAAANYGNLGNIYCIRAELDRAEQMYKRSLEVNEGLGRLDGVADQYGNLGMVYGKRGDLKKAEEMCRRSLEINEKLGRLKGMASPCGNLGNIYHLRGDLDKAEKMHRKSLEIEKKLGRLEGMASAYGNLGLIYQSRGDLDEAEKMHNQALEINKKLGRLEGMASQYGNLGLICETRGDLDRAEKMHNQALEIDENLGRLEGVANAYGNLGSIHRERGDTAKAHEYWGKALALFQKIGLPHRVTQVQGWIDGLSKE